MAVSNEINRVKFIAEDFDTYRQEALDFYQNKYPDDFNDLIATNMGNAIVDQLAFAMQALTFTVNRKASEYFFETARLNKSITKLSRMLGYPIRPASPAQVTATINFPEAPYSFPVTIPIGFKFQGPGDVIYEYRGLNPLVLLVGQTSLTTTLVEGQTRTQIFKSTGLPNQQFNLVGIPSDQYLYSSGMSLTVDGVTWDRIDIIKYQGSNTYEVLFTDAPPKLRFGDGIAGNVPLENAEIFIKFVYGRGRAGAIGTNQIDGPVETLSINGNEILMEVTNDVSLVGENPEDIRSVKAFASAFFRTQNAAVIKEDYDTIAMLESGVALADAQNIRGVSGDLTIISAFAGIHAGENVVSGAALAIENTGVSGLQLIGTSGLGYLGVSGMGGLYVGGIPSLGVSGINLLGVDVSGNITGLNFLGVSGSSALTVEGQTGVGVSGVSYVGVSGVDFAGVSGQSLILDDALSGIAMIENSVSGLNTYLSNILSDTSKSNHIQVVLLSVDSNNRYVSPTSLLMTTVEAKLQGMADAVVTVNVVDGSPNIVYADMYIEIGISDTAVEADVLQKSYDALAKADNPSGLLIRRTAGVNLYKSDVYNAVRDANDSVDIRFINVTLTGPLSQINAEGNLIIKKQQVIQDGNIQFKIFRESEFLKGKQ